MKVQQWNIQSLKPKRAPQKQHDHEPMNQSTSFKCLINGDPISICMSLWRSSAPGNRVTMSLEAISGLASIFTVQTWIGRERRGGEGVCVSARVGRYLCAICRSQSSRCEERPHLDDPSPYKKATLGFPRSSVVTSKGSGRGVSTFD